MKQMMVVFGVVCTLGLSIAVYADDDAGGMASMMAHHHAMMHGMKTGADQRISLQLPAAMRAQQRAMMREHLAAVNEIIADMAAGKFTSASRIAHQKLGLTPEMKKMCTMFGNSDFRKLGLAFHKSADHLGDELKSGNTKRSLRALHTTMNYCVQCHATFRQ